MINRQIWDLLEGRSLFHAFDPDTDTYASDVHLNEMISVLGPPPEQLLVRGESVAPSLPPEGEHQNFGDVDRPHGTGLEGTIATLSGEDKRLFLRFVRRMFGGCQRIVQQPENCLRILSCLHDYRVQGWSPDCAGG